MKRSMKISAVMHKLLIEKRMDGFSVLEARDASLPLGLGPSDLDEARKRIYRQIWQFEKKNWLRSEGEGRAKKYFQTEHFKETQFAAKKALVLAIPATNSNISDYSVLVHERNEYKGELEIVLGEIDEYQSIKVRFPELDLKLNPLLQHARERSALLLGKVNVLTNVLNALSSGNQEC